MPPNRQIDKPIGIIANDLRRLAADLEHYDQTIAADDWRQSLERCITIELEATLDRLRRYLNMEHDDRDPDKDKP